MVFDQFLAAVDVEPLLRREIALAVRGPLGANQLAAVGLRAAPAGRLGRTRLTPR
jgi:hypothetical protein